MNTPLPLTTVNRRAFIKTSILTAAAVGVLSQGKALAQTGSGFMPTPKIEYRLKCVEDPKSIFGKSLDGHLPTGTPRQTGDNTWETSVVNDIGTYPPGYDNSMHNIGRSSVYLKVSGKGPKKGVTGSSFQFVGKVHGQHSIRADDVYNANDEDEGTRYDQQLYGVIEDEREVRKFLPEIDASDINGEFTIDMSTQRVSLVLINDQPKMRWLPNPVQIAKTKIAPTKRTDMFSGPVYVSAAHDLAMIKGACSVQTSELTKTDSTSASLNAKLTWNTGQPEVEAGASVSRTVSHSLVAPTASTAVTDLLVWSITIEKRVDGGAWTDIGEHWEKAPTWQDKTV
jgi:hypothetical protein